MSQLISKLFQRRAMNVKAEIINILTEEDKNSRTSDTISKSVNRKSVTKTPGRKKKTLPATPRIKKKTSTSSEIAENSNENYEVREISITNENTLSAYNDNEEVDTVHTIPTKTSNEIDSEIEIPRDFEPSTSFSYNSIKIESEASLEIVDHTVSEDPDGTTMNDTGKKFLETMTNLGSFGLSRKNVRRVGFRRRMSSVYSTVNPHTPIIRRLHVRSSKIDKRYDHLFD